MINLIKAGPEYSEVIVALGIRSFLESHGHSAPKADIDRFINSAFDIRVIHKELSDSDNIYYLLLDGKTPAGYSKIRYNMPNPHIESLHVAKMERLYLLNQFYGKGLARQLMQHNLMLAQNENQTGMWLHVWVENKRALNFYNKSGYKIIGHYDYVISENHTNPNYVMYHEFNPYAN